MAELAALIKKRGHLKTRLTFFKTFLQKKIEENNFDSANIIEMQERTAKFTEILSQFDEIQLKIEDLCEDSVEQLIERDEFEANYFEHLSKAKALQEKADTNLPIGSIPGGSSVHSGSSRHSNTSALNARNNIRLPNINLTKFNGDLSKFQEFHDTYLSLVHENPSLSDIERFHYLRSVLEGEALDALHSIQFSAANYHNAWELLCERYLNKQLLAHNNIKLILNLPSMQKEVFSQMREIQDGLAKQLRSLRSLDLKETQLFESLIIFIITSKLDPRTVRAWEELQGNCEEFPTLERFQQFLKDKCSLLEVLSLKADHGSKPKRSNCLVNNSNFACYHCKSNHSIFSCDKFKKLSTSEKVSFMKNEKRCLNCLRRGHFSDKCTSGACKWCKGKHHTLLHEFKEKKPEQQKVPEENSAQSSAAPMPNQVAMCASSSINVLLATALVKVKDANGNEHSCRVLLDSGSQSNLISAKLVKTLNIPTQRTSISLTGVTQVSRQVESACNIDIKAEQGNFRGSVSCLVVQKVCGEIPSYPVKDTQSLGIPNNLQLADPTFYQPGEIDILLGAQWFFKLMCVGKITLNTDGLVIQRTKLGWVLSGPIPQKGHFVSCCNLNLTQSSLDIQQQLEKFWTLESCESSKDIVSECEDHFRQTTHRSEDGRFVVAIPLKEPYETLGDSYTSTKRRFLALERKLEADPVLGNQYRSFMSEYQERGHMSEDQSGQISGCYIPHHGVLNENSSTTKLRVVFDASMITSSGKSLNQLQMVGDTVQNELFTILLRFRRHSHALCADVEKMYRQVLVRSDDRPFQKILWRSEPSLPLKTFQLNTVTYGTASAPFLATRALYEVGNMIKTDHPKVAEVIQQDFYVDDMLSGADSASDAIQLAKEASSALFQAGFPLRKWRSNSTEVMQALQEGTSSKNSHEISAKEDARTLGLIWQQTSDEFLYKTDIFDTPNSATKRMVLSSIAKMFDPLGFLSPITVIAKIILQQMWLDKLSWDEELPIKTLSLWQAFCHKFSTLSEIKIPRYVLCENYVTLHLHGFSDSSEKAYGACLYVVAISPIETTSNLLCAKTRVAPLKPISIPRLELCAAHVLASLVKRVIGDFDRTFSSINLWSDSTIVLAWLRTHPVSLKTFVRNRVAQIQELTKAAKWKHVGTAENPADLLSRGTTPQRLKENSLWWNGPKWLLQSEDQWPKAPTVNPQSIPELKPQSTVLVSIPTQLPIDITRFSSLLRLQRSFAYCRRFINNCKVKSKEDKLTGPLSVSELCESLTTIIKFVQSNHFTKEIDSLKRRGTLWNKSPVLTLNPFLDNEQVLRVGGRLNLSNFPYDKKFPILLPKGHHLTKLIFSHEHLRLGHAGPELLLSSVRDHYWPICGRNTAKETFRKCVKCFRVNPTSDTPIMGNLPVVRFQQSYPFINTGMDYAGPIFIKNKNGRGYKLIKAYICLLVCLTTRAIHLEVVTNLSSETFLAAFRRFISRRGRPANVYSDNGTNFVGAKRELDEVGQFLMKHQTEICDATTTDGVTFHFIPPKSPHFGGMWEAGVKSTKSFLRKIIANAHLTYEGISTTLTQIEAILNSRPLSPLSSNPLDLEPLTPAHFLIGRKLTSLPEYNFESSPISRLSMFERAQQLAQHFWRRWSTEYVSQLQQRQKWKTRSPNVQKDTLVLIKDDNLPPLKWKLGRVIDLHPGKDGVVRVVSVKCSDSVTKRPCTKICPLPLN